ncbi:cytochrome P450 [Poseidonocella sedimentorum]|uniref:Cytochrome P450 n=1 Tax=Poseidonocella sedimentorum TaxID=871652 RepID=A0A1I6DLW4_9RHOB|nr:cytochrome P450 [Poseidonocella sedimentorum]SFR06483.1 hypothetical protein SAMN04515673_10492 [Poseidonocella sedimentorum]
MPFAPIDTEITIQQLTDDPYPVYKRLRAERPVLRVEAVKRTLLTKAEDCRMVKDNPALFSSNDPSTPMEKAFEAHTLMRKDGEEHMRERLAMTPSFSARNLKGIWSPAYEAHAHAYLDRLPRGEVVDLFPALAGPLSARILAEVLGIPDATDTQMQHWSQALIDGAGNFGWFDEPFERVAAANVEMNACIAANAERLRADPDQSALSVMVNAEDPIAWSQILANIKIAIGGGINEPRDAMLTILFGLLQAPEQLVALKVSGEWGKAFEEGVRWVAPIQASSRLVMEDTEIRGITIPRGEVVMTIQASANHDEERFDAPETFNVFRERNIHQSFGSGPHHCMGTHMARLMVGKILLPLIFERFPDMELVDPASVVWKGFGFRGPLNLPVRLN